MAITRPKCVSEFDATLFEFGHRSIAIAKLRSNIEERVCWLATSRTNRNKIPSGCYR